MYASEHQHLYFPMQDVVTVSVHTERCLNFYPFQFQFSSLDLKASTRDMITDILSQFYPPEKAMTQAGKSPIQQFKG